MRYYHRHSLFPLIVIILSALLAGLIFWSVNGEPTSTDSIPVQEVDPVDSVAYQSDLTEIMQTFDERLVASEDDLEKLLAAQTALADLLELRVPVEFKDLHLALAVALSDIEKSLQSEDRDITEPLVRIAQLKQTYPWLSR